MIVTTRVSKSTHNEGIHWRKDRVSNSRKDRHSIWLRWFQNEVEARYKAAEGGLEIIADVLRNCCESGLYRFAVIKLIRSEKSVESECFEVVAVQRDRLRRFVQELATKMGLECPDIAASATVLILERTIVRIRETGDLSELRTAQLLFRCLHCALSTRRMDEVSCE